MNKKNILITGRFNVLHPGHVRLFKFSKELGGKLYVGIESDNFAGNDAFVNENLRLEALKSNSWVDECFIFDGNFEKVFTTKNIHIIVKGKEHENIFNSELEIAKKYNVNLIFSSGESTFSSVDLIKKEFYETRKDSIHIPEDFLKRHNIKISRLKEYINNYNKIRVCVIGDLIVDEYITCQALGMSQEDPTIVVTPLDNTYFVGGAGIVAAHASGLGADVKFISISGNDSIREFALDKLKEYNVDTQIFIDENRPTTLKQRFRSKGKTLLRVSHLHQEAISNKIQQDIFAYILSIIDSIDLIVFSDFNYGCLPQNLVDQIINLASSKHRKIYLAADSQSSSQIGDISRYKNMDLITPTEHEARISTKNHNDGLVILSNNLKQINNAINILLKLGEEGLLINTNNSINDNFITDNIEALNKAPKDVSGAGDSLLISSALTLASGGTIWESSLIGSLAASIQVGRVGNTALKNIELLQILDSK